MQKVAYFGVAMILAGSVGVAMAQERVPQPSGFGTGVGMSAGTGTRSQVWDKQAMLEYLSAPETVFGTVIAIDRPAGKILLEKGGSSGDVRQTLRGGLNIETFYFDDKTNMQSIDGLNAGDQVSIQVYEATTEAQPYGTGKKMVRRATVVRGSQLLGGANNPGFAGGLGQRPDPKNAVAIASNDASTSSIPIGGIQLGNVDSGITSSVGAITGAAPCWQCAPQPDTVNGAVNAGNTSDYGGSSKKNLNFKKGTY